MRNGMLGTDAGLVWRPHLQVKLPTQLEPSPPRHGQNALGSSLKEYRYVRRGARPLVRPSLYVPAIERAVFPFLSWYLPSNFSSSEVE